jgi:hypothetical protein
MTGYVIMEKGTEYGARALLGWGAVAAVVGGSAGAKVWNDVPGAPEWWLFNNPVSQPVGDFLSHFRSADDPQPRGRQPRFDEDKRVVNRSEQGDSAKMTEASPYRQRQEWGR